MVELIDTCRMCLDTKDEFISLETKLDSAIPTASYLDAYNFCTNLNADLNDSFPSIICEECAHNLLFVYEILQKALRSDQLLREITEKQVLIEVENFYDSDDQKFCHEEVFSEDHIEESTSRNINEENSILVEEKQKNDEGINYQACELEYEIDESREKHSPEGEGSIVKTEAESSQEAITQIQLTCELCHEDFSTLEELSQHYTEHEEKSQSNETLHEHDDDLQESSNEVAVEKTPKKKPAKQPPLKSWCCEVCGKFFSSKQKLTAHNLVHTKEKNFPCSLCPKRHATIFRHRDHMKTHENIRNHECEYCKERFFSKSTLICHLRRHTGERPYKCDICGKAFTQASIMKTHAALHTGKTVECNLCSKKFTRPSHLILHRRSHTGERPYLCTHCPNRYRQKSHLDRHLDTHMGVKHTCDVCGKSYTKKSSLNTHLFVHMSTKQFKCVECQLEFTTKDRYNRHLKNTHKSTKSEENASKNSTPNETL